MMNSLEDLKHAGVNVHLICTGAGAGLQQLLWGVPGSSAYLSGCSFPYRPEETQKTLGFTPDSYCSAETAIDLACVAYQRAFSFGGKKPIGLGLTASVASEKEHRGHHRVYACVISDDGVFSHQLTLEKGSGQKRRTADGQLCDNIGLSLIFQAAGLGSFNFVDGSAAALERFFAHPFFLHNGERLAQPPDKMVLMPGSYNPPHPGHIGLSKVVAGKSKLPCIFHVTSDGPHKKALTLQDLLKRSRMLRGHDRLFTRGDALYLDKARRFPGTPIAMGSDSLQRMLDPKWGQDVAPMLYEMAQLGTTFYIANRPVDGKVLTMDDVLARSGIKDLNLIDQLFHEVPGLWDFSSTEIRAKSK